MKRDYPKIEVRREFPSLERIGVATAHFPRYINRRFRPHTVDVLLLSFIIRGRATHWMDGDSYEERGVSLGVTSYGCAHSIVTGPGGIDIMNIYLDPSRCALPVLPEPLGGALAGLIAPFPGFGGRPGMLLRISFERPEAALECARGLHRELNDSRPGWEEAARNFLKLFLIECARSVLKSGARTSSKASGSPRLAKMESLRKLLDERYRERFDLKRLSKYAGMGGPQLCRAFKNYTGQTLFEYLLDRRLFAAMRALRESDSKIASAAFECGFQDLSFFNRKFKKAVGMRPKEYRAKTQASFHSRGCF